MKKVDESSLPPSLPPFFSPSLLPFLSPFLSPFRRRFERSQAVGRSTEGRALVALEHIYSKIPGGWKRRTDATTSAGSSPAAAASGSTPSASTTTCNGRICQAQPHLPTGQDISCLAPRHNCVSRDQRATRDRVCSYSNSDTIYMTVRVSSCARQPMATQRFGPLMQPHF